MNPRTIRRIRTYDAESICKAFCVRPSIVEIEPAEDALHEGKASSLAILPSRLVIALPLVSFLLWVSSVYEARLGINRGIGEFGLVSILPLSFFASLSLLTICFLATLKIRIRSQIALFYDVMMLIVFLYLTPSIVEGSARFSNTYIYYQAVDYISQTGHINPVLQWVHTWPASSIAFSILVQITAIAGPPSDQVFLGLYPTLFNVALFFPLLSFVRMIVHQENLRWISIWVFYIANWVGQDYFSAQSFAFFIFVLLLLTLFKFMDSLGQTSRWLAVSVLLFCCLVTSHFLSSVASLAVVFALFAFKHFRRPAVLVLFALILASWTTYGAAARLGWGIHQVIAQALNLEFIVQANVMARVAGSLARTIVTQIRLIFSASIAMLALSGFVLARKRKENTKTEKRLVLASLGVCSVLAFFAYGGELFMRVFLLNLLTLAYFTSKGSDRKSFFAVTAVFLVIIAPPLHIAAHYGNETMDYVPLSEMTGVDFFQDKTTQGYLVYLSVYYRDLRYHESYTYFSFYDAQWKNNTLPLAPIEARRNGWPTFVCVSYADRRFYDFYLGQPWFVPEITKNLDGSTRYNKVYSDPGYELYAQL